MTTELTRTAKTEELTQKWLEAKTNEKGWADARRAIEKELTEAHGGYEALLAEIDDKPVLTTSANVSDTVKVGVGYTVTTDQPGISAFMAANPVMGPVLFKVEYKPQTKAVLNAMLDKNSPIGQELEKLVGFKKKAPGYAMR